MKTLILILCSFFAFAQKDTTIVTQKVVKIGSEFYIEHKTQTTTYKVLNAELMRQYEDIENEIAREELIKTQREADRKKYVKLLKQAIKDGYVPKSNNEFDDKINKRVIDKIKKEKL